MRIDTEYNTQRIAKCPRTAGTALELLQAHGIVECQPERGGTPGRPSRIWRLAADEALADFERACDEFKARMLRMQLDTYEKPDDAR